MPLFLPTTMRLYKLCAVFGIMIVIAASLFSWTRLQSLESNVSASFEEMVTINLEVTGLKTELQHVERVLQAADSRGADKTNITVDDITYSSYEIERLRAEKNAIILHVKEKELEVVSSSGIKTNVMNEVRLLFITSVVVFLIGALMTAFGVIGWYFKIEFFEDRRARSR